MTLPASTEPAVSVPQSTGKKITKTVTETAETTTTTTTTETAVVKEGEEEVYEDRFLEGNQRIIAYDLLEARGKSSETTDPDVQRYKKAKDLFKKGYDLCMSIPRSLEEDVLEKYEHEVRESAEDMIEAWLMDEKAAPMSERVLILGQQYEKVLLRNIPEEQKEGFFIKESLLFSAWILLVGKQFQHCITTLSLAIDTYDDLPACVYFIRASCHLSMNKLRLGIKDLETSLEKDPNFVISYSVIGSVYMSLKENENAVRNFKQYVQKGHPDTTNYFSCLYSLSVLLYHQKGKKAEAREFYNKARKAEARFQELYGTTTSMNETKRESIMTFGTKEEIAALQKQLDAQRQQQQQQQHQHQQQQQQQQQQIQGAPSQQYNAKIEQLIQSGFLSSPFPASPKQCSNCGASHRKDTADKPLLCCGGCKGIWYCARECQVEDYKRHKVVCKKAHKHSKPEEVQQPKAQTA
ncbi:hypothetical protein CLU79DRAFT_832452 [Phycomyces nitens]|nr:hypothetical protein CLU79DRAFT_832452 [Phycomyces nitens]